MGINYVQFYHLMIITKKEMTLKRAITDLNNKHLADGSWDVSALPGIVPVDEGRYDLAIFDYTERGTENAVFSWDGDLDQHEFHNCTCTDEIATTIEMLRNKGILTTGMIITNCDGVEEYTDFWIEGVHHGTWDSFSLSDFVLKELKKKTKE